MKDEIKRFYTFLRNNEQTLKELKNEITGKIQGEKTVCMCIISKIEENGLDLTYEDFCKTMKEICRAVANYPMYN